AKRARAPGPKPFEGSRKHRQPERTRSAIMQLPALQNASLINGQSIEDFIRNSTQNLQRMASAMPGSGVAGLRRHEWSVEAQPGGGRPEKPRPHPGAAARPVRRLHRVGQLVAAAEDKATAARRSLRRADVRAVAAEAAVAQRLQKGNRRPGLYARLRR